MFRIDDGDRDRRQDDECGKGLADSTLRHEREDHEAGDADRVEGGPAGKGREARDRQRRLASEERIASRLQDACRIEVVEDECMQADPGGDERAVDGQRDPNPRPGYREQLACGEAALPGTEEEPRRRCQNDRDLELRPGQPDQADCAACGDCGAQVPVFEKEAAAPMKPRVARTARGADSVCGRT